MNTMSPTQISGVDAQRAYYARTAKSYDEMHVDPPDEHAIALAWMFGLIEQRRYTSVLDVGSGTGRVLRYLKERSPVKLLGIEPSADLRTIGHSHGLGSDLLIAGDALNLPFPDDSFDLVCAYGVLHHIGDHARAVSEMMRVARRAVFISDANNFGQGSPIVRAVKQTLCAARLWRLADLIRTSGKGYHYSDGDGVFYSYSIFDDVPIIQRKFPNTLYMSTRRSQPNPFRSAPTVAMFASSTSA